jgi:hypothetical protein
MRVLVDIVHAAHSLMVGWWTLGVEC